MEMLTKVILTKLVGSAFDSFVTFIKGLELISGSDEQIAEESIANHIKYIENWTSSLSFRDAHESKSTLNVFVKLGFYLNRKRLYFDQLDENEIELEDLILSSKHHIVILGQPGAGKTTSVKYISQLMIWDEHFCTQKYTFPIVVRLRQLHVSTTDDKRLLIPLSDHLENILGFNFNLDNKSTKSRMALKNLKLQALANYLDSLRVILILDGLDEVGSHIDQWDVAKEISDLCLMLNNSLVIITCRTADFAYHIENSSIYELAPLNEDKVIEFTRKWLGSEGQSKVLFNDIKKSPFYDTAMRPLTLAHLCAIFEREARIPEKPKTAYRLVIELLLKEWDLQRGIQRISEYSSFEVDRKFDFLSRLSYALCEEEYAVSFESRELEEAYSTICNMFGLPNDQSKQVVNEIESHSGLILQAFHDVYEFAHKSIQEYFIADCISRMARIPRDEKTLVKYPNELAICVALSSNPNEYFIDLVFNRFATSSLTPEFFNVFVARTLLEMPDFYESEELGLAFALLCSAKTKDSYRGFVGLTQNSTIKKSLDLVKKYYFPTGGRYKKTGVKYRKRHQIESEEINRLMPKELILEYEMVRPFCNA